jgi:hypothetical protein
MKELAAGIVLILVLGIGALLYRNVVERPGVIAPEVACTAEAKLCPDGTAVGRQGIRCEFAACPYPNVEVADVGIAFVVPAGYVPDENAYGADTTLIAAFVKTPHTIVVRRYPIPEGEDAESVILSQVRYQPADEQAADFSRFRTVTLGAHTFRETTIERFEAMAYTSYFLVRPTDVLRFDLVEQEVSAWTDPALDISALPEHAAFRQLLSTLQAGS